MSDTATLPPDGITAGHLLRQAREAAGLHVASLAVALKVPVRKLEALEEDRYDQLPDLTFARALASSMCRTLKIDPQPVLERLPQTGGPRLVTDDQGINAPFRPAGEGVRSGWAEQLSRPVALTVLALLLAAVVLVFLPAARRSASAPEPAASSGDAAGAVATGAAAADRGAGVAAAADPAATTPAGPSLSTQGTPPALPMAPPPAVAPVTPDAVVTPGAAPAGAAAGTPATLARPAEALPVAAATPAPGASASAPAAATASEGGMLVLRASGSTWVQVTDARGTVVIQRLLQPGEAAGANGVPPLSVVIGNAQATSVEVRGKPFSLEPVARDNVARFQVQ